MQVVDARDGASLPGVFPFLFWKMNTTLTRFSEAPRCRTNFRALKLLKLSWLVLNHGGPGRHNEVGINSGIVAAH
jgi:hypothetical protein